jgi:hypothetical protein
LVQRLKLKHEWTSFKFAFNFNLRRYITVDDDPTIDQLIPFGKFMNGFGPELTGNPVEPEAGAYARPPFSSPRAVLVTVTTLLTQRISWKVLTSSRKLDECTRPPFDSTRAYWFTCRLNLSRFGV